MATCPNCEASIHEGAEECPKCGKRVIPASSLETISVKTTGWQKFVIIVTIILLVLIGITFQSAENREDEAAQRTFSQPVARIVSDAAVHLGLAQSFGMPDHKLKAETKDARVFIIFPRVGLSQEQASSVGQSIAALLARTYVQKGYMPRHITVTVASATARRKPMIYGKAIYNGNIDALGWEAAR